jgi:hypothetical protein
MPFNQVSRFIEHARSHPGYVLEVSPSGDAGCTELVDLVHKDLYDHSSHIKMCFVRPQALASGAGFLKAGGLARERVLLYNRLITAAPKAA